MFFGAVIPRLPVTMSGESINEELHSSLKINQSQSNNDVLQCSPENLKQPFTQVELNDLVKHLDFTKR